VADHDNSYKLLFSHSEMVADLLRGFIREDWVRKLDFSSLEKVGAEYVSDDMRGRESDIVWRLRWKGSDRWIYVYILLEFQSTVDSFMAVRVMTYLGLLYQDLIRNRHLTPSGKLPPVLPVVLYNGKAPWKAAQDVAELVETVPGGLEQYRPRVTYCLLDEARIADSEVKRNLAAALFRLEKSQGPEDIEKVLSALIGWLEEQPELRRAFTTWLVEVLLPARLPGQRIPQVADLQEVKSMLAERVKEWTEEWKQEGLQKGRQEGFAEALEQARAILRQDLEERFGPLNEEARQRLEAIGSLPELMRLSSRLGSAPSLAALGLTE
jgi:predicted transposase/invertase (TIGR01784 family)